MKKQYYIVTVTYKNGDWVKGVGKGIDSDTAILDFVKTNGEGLLKLSLAKKLEAHLIEKNEKEKLEKK